MISRCFTSHEGFTVGALSNIATNSASIEYISHDERPPRKHWVLEHARHMKRDQVKVEGDNNTPFLNYQNCGNTGLNNQEWLLNVADSKDIWDKALQLGYDRLYTFFC